MRYIFDRDRFPFCFVNLIVNRRFDCYYKFHSYNLFLQESDMDKGRTGVRQSLDRYVKKCEKRNKYKVSQFFMQKNWNFQVGQVVFLGKN